MAQAHVAILSVDRDTGMPAYRNQELAALRHEPFERIWALLVDGDSGSALPPAEPVPLPVRTGDARVDLQSALAHLAPVWAFRSIMTISPSKARSDLARASVLTLSFVAQASRSPDLPVVPQREVDLAGSITERFLTRWHGHSDRQDAAALDLLWMLLAEQGMTASTRVARLVAGTGSDAAACLSAAAAALSGPLAGGGAARSLELLRRVSRSNDATVPVREYLEGIRSVAHVPGFAVHGTAPSDMATRAAMLKAACEQAGAGLIETAEATARTMNQELAARGARTECRPDISFWAAVLLEHIGVPARMYSAFFACGRTAGWSAHVLDVQRNFARCGDTIHCHGHHCDPR